MKIKVCTFLFAALSQKALSFQLIEGEGVGSTMAEKSDHSAFLKEIQQVRNEGEVETSGSCDDWCWTDAGCPCPETPNCSWGSCVADCVGWCWNDEECCDPEYPACSFGSCVECKGHGEACLLVDSCCPEAPCMFGYCTEPDEEECTGHGASCSAVDNCCPNAPCTFGFCTEPTEECTGHGGSCNSVDNCCPNAPCTFGFCTEPDEQECTAHGGSCNSVDNCCPHAPCTNGFCREPDEQACTAHGGSCNFEDNCCANAPCSFGWCTDPGRETESDDDIISDVCFSSLVTVSVKGNNQTVSISAVQVGDEVLSASGKYKTVYSVDHFAPTKSAMFLQIYTVAADDRHHNNYGTNKDEQQLCDGEEEEYPLEVTPRHMVFLHGKPNPIPASAVKVGDYLQSIHAEKQPRLRVTRIGSVVRKGIYNPLTTDGTIVVNSGVVASAYSAWVGEDDKSDYIEILGGYKLTTHQNFFHTILKPYKYMCTGISLELCKTGNNQERAAIGKFGMAVYQRWLRQDRLVQNVWLSVVVGITFVMDIILNPYYCLAVTLFVLIMMSQKKREGKVWRFL